MKLEILGKNDYFPTHLVPLLAVRGILYTGEDGELKFKSIAPLVAKENGYLSRAAFKSISLSPRKAFTQNMHLHFSYQQN